MNLSPIFNKAIEWGLIDKNPVHGIKDTSKNQI
ncbi:putative integrase domain protein [Orientia tsutsugamushi str. TA716]|uniref:Putative integrase domain protein n=1 Tax=Orientia tsutsugamushi str. TA716 TaxID=1359175 RepID=A0A0F3NVV6_ORITS|nr:putative integrase domain protein [Orientia tsutsugamushi str. TA716]